jgi:PIN domain nuclease of toxin-antitoxin system
MTGVLLDTHALLWLLEGDERLGQSARAAITAAHAQGNLHVSAMSFWEIGMLVNKGRITLSRPLAFLRSDILSSGISELALSGDVMALATELAWSHQDSADRVIVASALSKGLQLITADDEILHWKNALKRLDARE